MITSEVSGEVHLIGGMCAEKHFKHALGGDRYRAQTDGGQGRDKSSPARTAKAGRSAKGAFRTCSITANSVAGPAWRGRICGDEKIVGGIRRARTEAYKYPPSKSSTDFDLAAGVAANANRKNSSPA